MQSHPVIKVILLFTILFIVSCAGPKIGNEEDKVITMEKTECFGTCPVYLIELYANRTVVLDARKFMDLEGKYFTKLNKDDFTSLIEKFSSSGFQKFDNSYESHVSDLPTTFISFREGNEVKKIKDYVGAPQELKELENKVAALIETLDWKKF